MKHIILFFILIASLNVHAQDTGYLTGKILDLDYNNEPLVFANILIKGTTKGTTSDFDAYYEIIDIEPGAYTIIYSFVGYETQEVNVEIIASKETVLNVSMKASAASLEEVDRKSVV